MQIRAYSPDDAEEVSDMVIRNLLEVNAKDYSQALMSSLASCFTPDAMTEGAREKEVFVGIEGGRIVATAALVDGGWIHDVFVDPHWHGRGLGRTIMNHLENLARNGGVRVVTLPSSITAVGFYTKLGYAKLREIESAEGLTEVLMEKRL